jgi:hypothetical protein
VNDQDDANRLHDRGRFARAVRGVYILREEGTPYVKIGKANGAWRRLGALRAGNPRRLRLVAVIPAEDPHKLECRLHDRFDEYRANLGGSREWFRLEGDLADYVENLPEDGGFDQFS